MKCKQKGRNKEKAKEKEERQKDFILTLFRFLSKKKAFIVPQ